MADKTLSLAEFGASIKAKYPAYKDVPDDEIGTRMLDKYPVYRERVATFTTSAEEPPESFGRQAGRAVLNSLPGIGGLVGGALSTPETLGTGTIAGVALGAAAGKGLRDLLAEGLGIEKPTTPEVKAVNIALEGGTTAALSALLPGIVEAAKNPRATLGELVELIPKRWRPVVPDVMKKAPAQMILQRPAWQNVQKAAAEAAESPATRTTGTSWTPAPMPSTRAAPLAGVPAEAEAMNAPKAPTPAPQEPPMAPPEHVAAPAKSPSQTLNEIAIAARRAKVKLTLADYDALTPAVQSGEMSAAEALAQRLESTKPPMSPDAEFASKYGLPSDAERTFPPNKSGLPTKPPTARKARGKIADLAEMPVTKAEPVPEPTPQGQTPEQIASQVAATKKKFTGKIADLSEMNPVVEKYAKTQELQNLSPEVDYALKWIEQDMEAIPYTKRSVIDHPDKGMGGARLGVGGSAGAKIYRNIVGEEGAEISGAGRSDVLKAIKNLRAGKLTPVGELVLGVAKDIAGMPMSKLQKLMETLPP